MDYKIENDSPVKKTIQITVSPQEVDAALAGAVATYKDQAQVDGFRKGKAPASMIEQKFHDQIYNEAKENLLNVHINDILGQLDVTPVSGIHMKGDEKEFEKGKEFIYTIDFEVLPKFKLPPYEGLKVEEEKTVLDEKEVDMVLERMRSEKMKLQNVDTSGPAKDGQVAVIDFEAFEGDEPLKDFKASDFNLELGDNQALPDFERIVKGIPVGHTAEETIKIPEDFIAKEIAGKDIKFKITVHAVKEKILPELDDAFAKNAGFESLEKLKELIQKSYLANMKDMNKGVAQRKLLNQMLKQCEFEIPPSMLDQEVRFMVINEADRLARQGKSVESLGKTVEELKAAFQPAAENMARDKILLLNIAKKENLEVTPEELQKNVYRNCLLHGEDYKEVMKNLEENGLIFHLRDQMICDKAMDLVYDRAEITMVEPEAKESGQTSSETDGKEAAAAGSTASEAGADAGSPAKAPDNKPEEKSADNNEKS